MEVENEKIKMRIMLTFAVCMTMLMVMNVLAEEVPECTSGHTVGNLAWSADYTECGGGFKEAHYYCTVCNWGVDAEGNPYMLYLGDDNHTMISVPEKAAMTQADGNYAYWLCEVCGGTFKDQHGKEYIKDINTYMIPKLQPVTDNPATGDQAPIALIVSLMAMCVLVLGVSYRKLLKTKL